MKPSPIILNLGPDFYDRAEPARFPKSILRYYNQDSARLLQLEHLTQTEIQDHFWAFKPFRNNIPYPLALRYHGHQFRNYNPELGDGRGFLTAQFVDRNRKIQDLTTKGSGTTLYSRSGDGRLTLKGAIREILATEMLESLGVNTSHTFCVFETGEELDRQDEPSPTRGAVLTRRMHSSIRFGTFQRLAFFEEHDNIRKLVGYCLDHYYPDIKVRTGQNEAAIFLKAVMRKTAELTAQIMMAGFVHAVLNTDNMNITGEVFDFGPFRFMPTYNPYFTAAYFDRTGLYCYGRQPESFLWGLDQLGQSLKKAYPELSPEAVLKDFVPELQKHMQVLFLQRLNLAPQFDDQDEVLLQEFFHMLESGRYLFEQTFYDFYSGYERQAWKTSPQKELYKSPEAQAFITTLKKFKVAKNSWVMHPYFQDLRPETLLIHEIEALWQAIALEDNWRPFQQKIDQIRNLRGAYLP